MIPRTPYTGLASATSTNNTARNGASLSTEFAAPGGIAVYCTADVNTSSVVATFKLQMSPDNGTSWYDLSGSADSSTFATAAGTGSTVTTAKWLWFPIAAHAATHVRAVATLSGATTGGSDLTAVTYWYVPVGKLPTS